jgi:5-methylcytosine-specific restriction protein A
MNDAIVSFAVKTIHQRIGVPVHAQINVGPPTALVISPDDTHPNDSFSIRFFPGWRAAEAEFIPGGFSAPLVSQMGKAPLDSRNVLAAFASALEKRKTRLTFRVNGRDVSPFQSESWPDTWTRVELQARSAPQVIEQDDLAQMRQLICELVVPLFGMVVALIGVDEPDLQAEGGTEGTQYQTLTTRYERKKINREACIQLKGLLCAACNFDFSAFYGLLGAGYVEIHHTAPISRLGPGYRINVETDLEPLCANCHAMVHRQDPPLLVHHLAELVASRRGT